MKSSAYKAVNDRRITRSEPLKTGFQLRAAHFAFMRAVVQGMDPNESWDRYLSDGESRSDARQVRRTSALINDAFAAAARRHHRHGLARLVTLDLATTRVGDTTLPTLQEFVGAEELDGFSEAEQLTLYRQRYGPAMRRRQRHARLIALQLQALNWLQQRVLETPSANDPLLQWLDPQLAEHLAAVNIRYVHELVARMRSRAPRWWRGIPSIGVAKASRIADWVEAHAQMLGPGPETAPAALPAESCAQTPSRSTPSCIAPVPLHRLVVPQALDGSQAPLRLPQTQCRIPATTDIEALRIWLHRCRARHRAARPDAPLLPGWEILGNLTHTQRAYWKEAQRYQLWLLCERHTTLSAATVEDCRAYLDFLNAPTAAWCSPRNRSRGGDEWRPFEGPLSLAARRVARTVLRSLYRFLVAERYLAASPWETQEVTVGTSLAQQVGGIPDADLRVFDADALDVIERQLARLAPTSTHARLQFAVQLLQHTGMRLSEALRATTDDLAPPSSSHKAWRLRIPKEHGDERSIILSSSLTSSLRAYLAARGFEPAPDFSAVRGQGIHLLGRATDVQERAPWAPCAQAPIDCKAGIGAGTLRDQLADFFRVCAQACASRPTLVAQFNRASSHWLRGAGGKARQARVVPAPVAPADPMLRLS